MVLNPSMKYKKHQMQLLFNVYPRKQMFLIGNILSWQLNPPCERKRLLGKHFKNSYMKHPFSFMCEISGQ